MTDRSPPKKTPGLIQRPGVFTGSLQWGPRVTQGCTGTSKTFSILAYGITNETSLLED